jgi:hypothetical protein
MSNNPIRKEKKMELNSMTMALTEIVKVMKRFVYFQDPSSYLVLGLFVLQTYCFRHFDTTPYIFLNGPHGSGKTQALEILRILCHRALLVSSISDAGFYYAINQLRGCLILDEAEYLSMRYQHVIDMAVLNHGYKTGGFVIRVDPGKRKLVRFNCFGPKIFANIAGVYSKPLKSRCITIKTVPAERELERFSTIIHGRSLKELATAINLLFKRKKVIEKIKLHYKDFGSIKDLTGRDLELWMGMLVLAKIIDSEGVK